jgi:hypothetical protein
VFERKRGVKVALELARAIATINLYAIYGDDES